MLGDAIIDTLRVTSHENSNGNSRSGHRKTSVNIKDRSNFFQTTVINRETQNEQDISKKLNFDQKNLIMSSQDGIQCLKPQNLNQNTIGIKSQVASPSTSKSRHKSGSNDFFAQIYASRIIANQTDLTNNQKSFALCMDDLERSFNLNIDQSARQPISPSGRHQSVKPSVDQQVFDHLDRIKYPKIAVNTADGNPMTEGQARYRSDDLSQAMKDSINLSTATPTPKSKQPSSNFATQTNTNNGSNTAYSSTRSPKICEKSLEMKKSRRLPALDYDSSALQNEIHQQQLLEMVKEMSLHAENSQRDIDSVKTSKKSANGFFSIKKTNKDKGDQETRIKDNRRDSEMSEMSNYERSVNYSYNSQRKIPKNQSSNINRSSQASENSSAINDIPQNDRKYSSLYRAAASPLKLTDSQQMEESNRPIRASNRRKSVGPRLSQFASAQVRISKSPNTRRVSLNPYAELEQQGSALGGSKRRIQPESSIFSKYHKPAHDRNSSINRNSRGLSRGASLQVPNSSDVKQKLNQQIPKPDRQPWLNKDGQATKKDRSVMHEIKSELSKKDEDMLISKFEFRCINCAKLNDQTDLDELYFEFKRENLFNRKVQDSNLDSYLPTFFARILMRFIKQNVKRQDINDKLSLKVIEFCFEQIGVE